MKQRTSVLRAHASLTSSYFPSSNRDMMKHFQSLGLSCPSASTFRREKESKARECRRSKLADSYAPDDSKAREGQPMTGAVQQKILIGHTRIYTHLYDHRPSHLTPLQRKGKGDDAKATREGTDRFSPINLRGGVKNMAKNRDPSIDGIIGTSQQRETKYMHPALNWNSEALGRLDTSNS